MKLWGTMKSYVVKGQWTKTIDNLCLLFLILHFSISDTTLPHAEGLSCGIAKNCTSPCLHATSCSGIISIIGTQHCVEKNSHLLVFSFIAFSDQCVTLSSGGLPSDRRRGQCKRPASEYKLPIKSWFNTSTEWTMVYGRERGLGNRLSSQKGSLWNEDRVLCLGHGQETRTLLVTDVFFHSMTLFSS